MRRFALCLVVILAACRGSASPLPVVPVTLSQGSATVRVRAEVAATQADRERGLMNRISLARDAGMLFVFATPVQVGFWMKDTLIPLDIAFISAGKVVEIDTMTPCKTQRCPVTTPGAAYDRALEVAAGLFRASHIAAGADVAITGTLPEGS